MGERRADRQGSRGQAQRRMSKRAGSPRAGGAARASGRRADPGLRRPGAYHADRAEAADRRGPRHQQLEDPQERARVIRVFERGLDKPAGYVLPVQVWHSQEMDGAGSRSVGRCGRQKLFLLPGDSPVGFRLPLGSLPYIAADGLPQCVAHRSLPGAPRMPTRDRLLRDRRESVTLLPPEAAPPFPNEVGRLGAHRDGDRAARRALVRVHAAALRRGGLCRARRRRRGSGEDHRAAHSYRRLSAAATIGASMSSR